MRTAIVADRRAGGIEARGQRRVGDDASPPYGGEHIVLGDDTVAAADEEFEEIEDLRLERNERRPAAELAAVGVEHVVFE